MLNNKYEILYINIISIYIYIYIYNVWINIMMECVNNVQPYHYYAIEMVLGKFQKVYNSERKSPKGKAETLKCRSQ